MCISLICFPFLLLWTASEHFGTVTTGKYSNSFHGNINTLMITVVRLQGNNLIIGYMLIVNIVVRWYKHDLSVYVSQ